MQTEVLWALARHNLLAPADVAALTGGEICHGYANGCVCEGCIDRASKPRLAAPAPAQPWGAAA